MDQVSQQDRYALETNEIKYNLRIETALKSFDVEAADEKERNSWIAAITDARTKHRQKAHGATDTSAAASKWRKGYNKLRMMLRRPGAAPAAAAAPAPTETLEDNEVRPMVQLDCCCCRGDGWQVANGRGRGRGGGGGGGGWSLPSQLWLLFWWLLC